MPGCPPPKRRLGRATLPWCSAVKIAGLQARDGWAPERRPEPSSHTACKRSPSLAHWASIPSQIQSAPDPRCSGLRARQSPPQVPLLGPTAACNASSNRGGVTTSFTGALPADLLPPAAPAAAADAAAACCCCLRRRLRGIEEPAACQCCQRAFTAASPGVLNAENCCASLPACRRNPAAAAAGAAAACSPAAAAASPAARRDRQQHRQQWQQQQRRRGAPPAAAPPAVCTGGRGSGGHAAGGHPARRSRGSRCPHPRGDSDDPAVPAQQAQRSLHHFSHHPVGAGRSVAGCLACPPLWMLLLRLCTR